MPLNFPSNPAVNDQYTFAGRTWVWNGSAWDSYNPGITAYVSAVNGFTGGITLAAGSGITLTGSAKTITISTIVGVGATGPTGPQGNTGATGPVGDYVISFNGLTGAISGVNSVNGLTGALSLLASTGISIAAGGKGITFTNTGVQSFNGSTGAISGVNSANGLTGTLTFFGGTGISVQAGGKGITLINTGVSSVNGLTGAVTLTSVSTSAVNTFTAQQNFAAGLSAASSALFFGGINTDSVTVNTSNTLTVNTGPGTLTVFGDQNNDGNFTTVFFDDVTPQIALNCPNGTVDVTAGTFTTSGTAQIQGSLIFGSAAAYLNSYTPTLLGTTAANQTIATTPVVSGGTPEYRTIEYLIQASTASAFESLKITGIHDGTNTYNTQYALVRSGGSLGTYTTTLTGVSNKSMLLRVTPTTVNTTYTVIATIIPA